MEPLARWIERQYRHSAHGLMRSVSAVKLVKSRPGFGQTVTAHKGSVVASPVLGAYDPEPDYFFHWYRDSAIVVDAMRILYLDEQEIARGGLARDDLIGQFADFVRFSLSLQELDGRTISHGAWRNDVAPNYRRFLRREEDLAAARGEAIGGETRVNPDGTLDISDWPRPQHDGPALRAITLLRWLRTAPPDEHLKAAAGALLRADISYARRHWRTSCFDIWEEEKGLHYYALRVAAAALDGGADWLEQQGNTGDASACRTEAGEILKLLDGYWRDDLQFYRSRILDEGATTSKELDISVILAALHARGSGERHSVRDARMRATLTRLETLFDAEYAINLNRPESRAPAMGRYSGDVYYSGGAYYFSTLGAAEFCFRAAGNSPDMKTLVEHGDAFLETVRAFTPPSGDLSEQFDQRSGVQRSAPQLAWSYAAFISCAEARRHVIRDA
jgi:glucoamylase